MSRARDPSQHHIRPDHVNQLCDCLRPEIARCLHLHGVADFNQTHDLFGKEKGRALGLTENFGIRLVSSQRVNLFLRNVHGLRHDHVLSPDVLAVRKLSDVQDDQALYL